MKNPYGKLAELFQFPKEQYRVRLICGTLAVIALASIYAIENFASEERLKFWIEFAVICFSLAVTPLALISVFIWPKHEADGFYYVAWVGIFFAALVFFSLGILGVIANIGWPLALIALILLAFVIRQACRTAFKK
jgi:hypothetical protein